MEQGEPTAKGTDRVEFLIATNPGEPLRPLAKVASGGEISRVMLAVKSALARQEPLPTMVFDEIDVGVGGPHRQRDRRKDGDSGPHRADPLHHAPGPACQHGASTIFTSKRTSSATAPPSAWFRSRPKSASSEVARMIGGAEVTRDRDAARPRNALPPGSREMILPLLMDAYPVLEGWKGAGWQLLRETPFSPCPQSRAGSGADGSGGGGNAPAHAAVLGMGRAGRHYRLVPIRAQ